MKLLISSFATEKLDMLDVYSLLLMNKRNNFRLLLN